MEQKIYSFDVFDTVITRIWANPTDLFWEVGHQLKQHSLITITAYEWKELRIKAQRKAKQLSSKDEITLQQIYDCLAPHLNWSSDCANKAQQIEIAIELASLRPVPETQKKIQALHRHKKKVIYISDMYLPQDVIKLCLIKNQIWADGDILYVSSTAGVKKGSGLLFQHCLQHQSIKASQLHHVGDNRWCDWEVPRKLGIQAQHFTSTNLNRYETLIALNERIPWKLRSTLAGSSRITRLQCSETNYHQQTIWSTAASAIAPVLFGFVNWCLQEAEDRGIERLYFVARDGQILLKIAHVLCQNWGYQIDCRYLYGSRQAWHFPAIQTVGEQELEWVIDGSIFLSIYSICDRVNITPEQISDALIANGFAPQMWERNLVTQERALLKQVFRTEPAIYNLIVATAEEYRSRAIGYFKQEGLGDGVKFGIVDTGWKARGQRSVSKLLDIAQMYPETGISGFYFGLKKRSQPLFQDCSLAYFQDETNPSPTNIKLDSFLIRLLEIFTAADHGSTIRFDRDGDGYCPILRYAQNNQALDWGLEVQHQAIVKFAKNFSTVINQDHYDQDLFLDISETLLTEFIQHPTKEEAITFGSYKDAPDVTESTFYELAPKVTLKVSLRLLFGREQLPHHAWRKGVIARSNSLPVLVPNFQSQMAVIKQIIKQIPLIKKISQNTKAIEKKLITNHSNYT